MQDTDAGKIAEIRVPYRLLDDLGQLCWLGFLGFVASAGCRMAVENLARGDEFLFSLIWLGFVACCFFGYWAMTGLEAGMTRMMGALSWDHYVQIRPGAPHTLHIGFRFLGGHRDYRVMPLDDVREVTWGMGQGSARVGRDVGDWSVDLWHVSNEEERRRQPRWTMWLQVFSLSTTKERATRFGEDLIRFLEEAGVKLQPGSIKYAVLPAVTEDRSRGPDTPA